MDPNVIDTIVLVSCVAFTGAVAAIARWYAKHPVNTHTYHYSRQAS
ncbi:MAG TPA: hypothetical protein VFS00_15495 [Polyangiaceae bacterium]|nr:hypothetical protein [Polyangiaceae bacterium]